MLFCYSASPFTNTVLCISGTFWVQGLSQCLLEPFAGKAFLLCWLQLQNWFAKCRHTLNVSWTSSQTPALPLGLLTVSFLPERTLFFSQPGTSFAFPLTRPQAASSALAVAMSWAEPRPVVPAVYKQKRLTAASMAKLKPDHSGCLREKALPSGLGDTLISVEMFKSQQEAFLRYQFSIRRTLLIGQLRSHKTQINRHQIIVCLLRPELKITKSSWSTKYWWG